MSLSDYLNTDAKIYLRSLIAGELGQTERWALRSTVKCRIDPLPMDKRYIQGFGQETFADVTLYCAYTTIEKTDRVIVGTTIYEVVGPDNPMSMDEHLEVYLKRLPDDVPMIMPGAVAGATQVLASGAWGYEHFYKIENQNALLAEITINSVTGSVDGALVENVDYFKGQNEKNEWGIFITNDLAATRLTTLVQSITINYNYNSSGL